MGYCSGRKFWSFGWNPRRLSSLVLDLGLTTKTTVFYVSNGMSASLCIWMGVSGCKGDMWPLLVIIDILALQMLIRGQPYVSITSICQKHRQNADTWKMKSLFWFLFAGNMLSVKLSRISKPQSHTELDVALEVQTPVNSTSDLCDWDLFSHLCNGNTFACWAHWQCSCACQTGMNIRSPMQI